MKYFRWLNILVIFSLPLVLFAQKAFENNLIKVGDKKLNASRIQSGVNKFVLFRVSKGIRLPLFFLTRTITIEKRNDLEVIVVEQKYDSASSVNTDTSVLLRNSLAPLAYTAKLSNRTESFEFTSTKVSGKITSGEGKVENIEIPLQETVFNAVTSDELIESLALNKNSRIGFHLYNPGKQFVTNTLQVIGSERILLADGTKLDTWLISLEGSTVPTKIWVAKSNQRLIQQKSELPNGDEFWKVRLYG